MRADLENRMKPIVYEMFKNGFEEGNRIWCDHNHPLTQQVAAILREHASDPETLKKGAALLEERRREEEES